MGGAYRPGHKGRSLLLGRLLARNLLLRNLRLKNLLWRNLRLRNLLQGNLLRRRLLDQPEEEEERSVSRSEQTGAAEALPAQRPFHLYLLAPSSGGGAGVSGPPPGGGAGVSGPPPGAGRGRPEGEHPGGLQARLELLKRSHRHAPFKAQNLSVQMFTVGSFTVDLFGHE